MYCMTIKLSKVDFQFFKRITLIDKLFSEKPPYVYKITIRGATSDVCYNLWVIITISWRFGHIAANVREVVLRVMSKSSLLEEMLIMYIPIFSLNYTWYLCFWSWSLVLIICLFFLENAGATCSFDSSVITWVYGQHLLGTTHIFNPLCI